MKRWLAMALCAVLLVGVLPVVAGADSGSVQFYSELGENGEPSGTPSAPVPIGPLTGLVINYQSGDSFTGLTRYLYDSETTFTSDSFLTPSKPDSVDVTVLQQNTHVLAITVGPSSSGSFSFNIKYPSNDPSHDYIIEVNDTNTTGGGDNPFADLTEIWNSHPVAAGDEKVDPEAVEFQPVPFIYNDTTYYIGPAWAPDQHNGDPVMGDSEGFLENEGNRWKFRIGFWIASPGQEGLEYTRVDDTLYATLFREFENLTITMKPTANCTTFPALYHDGNQTHLYADVNHNTSGLWVLQVTGERNGIAITAYGDSKCLAQTSKVEAPDYISSLDDVTTYFSSIASTAEDNSVYTFVIPAGEYTGTITTPVTPNDATFEIRGAQVNGNNAVTIQGGVIANADETRLTDLQFEGTDKSSNCLTGTGRATFWHCSFRNYNTAVTCTDGLRWGGSQCLFENNQVALHMNSTSRNGGNGEMSNCVFRDNGIALKLECFAPGMPIYAHHMTDCQFINNWFDVDNTSGRMFFMPKQFFGTQANGSDVPTPGSPKFGSAGNVSAFPTATTTSFDTFDYSPMEALVSNQIEYTIPSGNLTGKTITVIDQTADADKTLATWSFENEAGGTEP